MLLFTHHPACFSSAKPKTLFNALAASNLFSAVRAGYSIDRVIYDVNANTHSESLYLSYKDSKGSSRKIILTDNVPVLTLWMQFLDLDNPDIANGLEAIKLLGNAIALIEEKKEVSSNKELEMVFNRVMPVYKEAVDKKKLLGIFYPLFYNVFNSIYEKIESDKKVLSVSFSEVETFNVLKNKTKSLNKTYKTVKKYVDEAIILPSASFSGHTPKILTGLYSTFLYSIGGEDFYANTPWMAPVGAIIFTDNTVDKKGNKDWESFIADGIEVIDEDEPHINIVSVEQFLRIGIDAIIQLQFVIRKCENCGRYFLTKHSSKNIICNRLYGNTKATCNDTILRNQYKAMLRDHPIHKEFTRSYNRLYARIRRGKLPEDTSLMEELKKLHNEYVERYDNTTKPADKRCGMSI